MAILANKGGLGCGNSISGVPARHSPVFPAATGRGERQSAERAPRLRRVSVFESVPDDELRDLSREFVDLELREGECVYRQGERPDGFFVVDEGCVSICRRGAEGDSEPVARLGPGDFFGEAGLFDGRSRSESVVCEADTRLLGVDHRALLGFLSDRPLLTLQLQLAAARAHTTNVKTSLAIAQRRAVRRRVGEEVRLTAQDDSPRSAILIDVSPLGMQMEGVPEEWQRDEIVRFGLDWAGSSLLLRGQIAWRRDASVGLAFKDLSPQRETQMQQAVGHLLDEFMDSRGSAAP